MNAGSGQGEKQRPCHVPCGGSATAAAMAFKGNVICIMDVGRREIVPRHVANVTAKSCSLEITQSHFETYAWF